MPTVLGNINVNLTLFPYIFHSFSLMLDYVEEI